MPGEPLGECPLTDILTDRLAQRVHFAEIRAWPKLAQPVDLSHGSTELHARNVAGIRRCFGDRMVELVQSGQAQGRVGTVVWVGGR